MHHRILLADDCPAVRDAVRRLLEREHLQIVGEASTGRDAMVLAASTQPDVAVLDWSMAAGDGLQTARRIHESCPATRVVLLSVHATEGHVMSALRAGVLGYVAKADAAEHLVPAIAEVGRGRIYLSSAVIRVVTEALLPFIGVGE